MFLDEDLNGEQRKGGTSAGRRVSSKTRSGHMPGSASGDPMMVTDSQSTADGATGSERTRGNQSVDSLTHRPPAAVCPIQRRVRRVSLPNMAGGGRRGLVPTVRSSEGAGKGIQRGSERAERVTTLYVVVCSVRQWLSDGESWRDKAGGSRGGTAEPISQAAHLGIGCGPVSGDVEYPRDSSERGTSANSGEIPDANARPTKPLSIERGPNRWAGATDEQRAKNTESTGASPQESGGQVFSSNLAESLAIWGSGEDDEDHMSLQ